MSHTPPPGVLIVPDATAPTPAPSLWASLTAREQQVARYLADAFSNREIAQALNVSIKTIDTHRWHLIKKLDCKNNVGLTRMLIREGIVLP